MVKTVLTVLLCILASSLFANGQNHSSTKSGIDLYRAGNFSDAVGVLQSAAASEKGDKFAWVYLGASHLKLGDTKNAGRAFRRSGLTYRDKPEVLDTPLKFVRKPRPTYSRNAQLGNVTGEVKVAVEFKADGTIGFVFPFQTLPEGLTESAIRAAKSITFEPAIRNGQPVDAVSVLSYTFSIR